MSKRCAPWIENEEQFTHKTYSVWLNKLYDIAISRFEWLNLPPTCDERFIEQVLLFNGYMVGFKDEDLGIYLILPCINGGLYNMMGYPTDLTAYGYDGYNKQNLIPYNALYNINDETKLKPNAALLYANYTRTPIFPALVYYARKLTKIDRTIDVNLNVQKTPWMIVCEENARMSVLNAFKKIDNFESAVVGTKYFVNEKGPFRVLDLNAEFLCDKLQTVKRQIWQEALTQMGIEANTSEKTERQVASEIEVNMGETEALRQSPLAARKQFCDHFNRVFKTNIDVRFRSDLSLSRIMEGFDDDILHDDPTRNLSRSDGKNGDVGGNKGGSAVTV